MKNISKEEILKLTNDKKTFIVQFSASWCGPCRTLSPILEKVCNKQKVDVYKFDVSKDSEYAKELGITSIPVVTFYKGGEEFDTSLGLKPVDFYEERVKSLAS